VVLETSWRRHQHIEPFAQRGPLRAVADAAEDRPGAQVGEAGEIAHGRLDLHGQLAGGLEHEAAQLAVAAEFLERGQGERGGLARPGLGGRYDVTAFEGRRDRPELNRGRIPVTHRLDALEKWLGESKLRKWHEPWTVGPREGFVNDADGPWHHADAPT
jgi:hypothetical protein